MALRCILRRSHPWQCNGSRQLEAGLDPERSESDDRHRLATCQAVVINEFIPLTDFLLGASRLEHPIVVRGGCMVPPVREAELGDRKSPWGRVCHYGSVPRRVLYGRRQRREHGRDPTGVRRRKCLSPLPEAGPDDTR